MRLEEDIQAIMQKTVNTKCENGDTMSSNISRMKGNPVEHIIMDRCTIEVV
jgi:hypothetical protein